MVKNAHFNVLEAKAVASNAFLFGYTVQYPQISNYGDIKQNLCNPEKKMTKLQDWKFIPMSNK